MNSMGFYQSIAPFYDHIFPLKTAALTFTKKFIPSNGVVVDAGSAAGSLAIAIAPFCNTMKAFDLDKEMVGISRKKAGNISNISFFTGDLMHIGDYCKPGKVDLIVCYGNTIVHLLTHEQIKSFLKQCYASLKNQGVLALQLLNYDFIFDEKVTELPVIENDTITFTRKYRFRNNSNIIDFDTHLKVKSTNQEISNSVPLLALRPPKLRAFLIDAGFSNFDLYSSFQKDPLDNKKMPLVVVARK